MIKIYSKKQLKDFVPSTDDEKVVIFIYGPLQPKIYYWDEGWVEKRYWTIEEAAKFLNVDEYTINQVISHYNKALHIHRTHYKIKMRYSTLMKIKFILTHSNLKKLSYASHNNLSTQII